jgi:fucose 4-O-acetylase-like acetyltransferase
MDLTRGTAIAFVMLFHSASFFSDNGVNVPAWLATLNGAFTAIRMPLLIFLSGILLKRSLNKGVLRFAYGKFRSLLWPYVLWVTIFCIVAGKPGVLDERYIWAGGTYLWYIAFLLLFFAVAVPLARVPFLITALVALFAGLFTEEASKYGERLLVMMSFFFLGAFVGERLDAFVRLLENKWSLVLVPLLLAFTTLSALDPIRYYWGTYAIVATCLVGVCVVARHMDRYRASRPLKYVGRHSLIFYVSHMPVIILVAAAFGPGPWNQTVVSLACLACSVAVGVALVALSNRFRAVNLLFAAPNFALFKRRRAVAGATASSGE